MKNLATAEEMEQLLNVYVQAVAHMRALQLCPLKLKAKNHRELLRAAEAEVDDLTILHQANPPSAEQQQPAPDVTDFAGTPPSPHVLSSFPLRS